MRGGLPLHQPYLDLSRQSDIVANRELAIQHNCRGYPLTTGVITGNAHCRIA